jgi:hypothetical protein
LGLWIAAFPPGAAAEPTSGPAEEAVELSAEDRELLEELELLLQWELLFEWDPETALPIAVEEPDRATEEPEP